MASHWWHALEGTSSEEAEQIYVVPYQHLSPLPSDQDPNISIYPPVCSSSSPASGRDPEPSSTILAGSLPLAGDALRLGCVIRC